MSNKLAVVAAGGTGGHLFPAEALALALKARGWRIVLATDTRGAEYANDFPAEERLALEAATFRMGDPIGMTRGGLKIAQGVLRAQAAFRRLKPQCGGWLWRLSLAPGAARRADHAHTHGDP